MLSSFASIAAEAVHHNELPVPPWAYGLFALLVFGMMLGVLFAFRQAATKIPASHNTVAHDEHGHDVGDHH
ncbi:hypothetical protein ACTHQ1_03465 [Janibacter anophelis]|uniref:hypothetical protein n=1 Tax=Janibacter anophelis TaxID=319054 RepID=UPI003F7D7ABC